MHPFVGEVSRRFCQFTGAERVGFCNTGSEAVLGAMRIARTVTGRKLIVAFTGAYHGIVDEVIVRGSKALKTFPASAGIMAESVQNMLILDYGTDESLEIIKQRVHELAAVLVEPVQSRRPDFLPVQFLKDLRDVTEQAGTALIFDEVITGLRMHQGGMQAILGIKADLGTYGKILGGGMPIGAIAGKKLWMDTLDGGFWQYGDESVPESGVTYFAGTFVRHPLAMAAAKATLLHLKEKGNSLQERLTNLTTQMADEMNAFCESHKLPLFIAHYGSLWKVKWHDNLPYSELLFTLMRQKGIHIWDGFPCFMTVAHTLEETKTVINSFQESLLSMIETGFFENPSKQNDTLLQERILEYYQEQEYKKLQNFISNAPIAGARLGKDPEGNPSWYIADPKLEGKFLQVQLS
jgi:glutamate-1-semialdehyde aminotransferase